MAPQQLEHHRSLLIARRDELTRETARAESEVVDQADREGFDPIDRATADNAKDELLQAAGRDSEQLAQVEDALRAIEHGTYGVCQQCGKDIPSARLDAVPWATLCIQDQEVADNQRRSAGVMTGGAPSRVVA